MKRGMIGLMVIVLAFGLAATAIAASYQPRIFHHLEKAETRKQGDAVYLFYGGTDDAREAMHIGDTLSVYRTDQTCATSQTGRIRILSYAGDYYIKAEVMDGEIKTGDIARKGKASGIVITVDVCSE